MSDKTGDEPGHRRLPARPRRRRPGQGAPAQLADFITADHHRRHAAGEHHATPGPRWRSSWPCTSPPPPASRCDCDRCTRCPRRAGTGGRPGWPSTRSRTGWPTGHRRQVDARPSVPRSPSSPTSATGPSRPTYRPTCPPSNYLAWLAASGCSPSLSLFTGSFDDPATHGQMAEQAGRFAATQATFGLTVCMISTIEPPAVPGWPTPRSATTSTRTGCGPSSTASRLSCRAMQAEGVQAALHPHVGAGSRPSTEIRTVLDEVGPDLLAFGPDTGHMSWAGMDVAAVLPDYSERIVGVHLKDTFAAGIDGRQAARTWTTATPPCPAGSGPNPVPARPTWRRASQAFPTASPATS